MMMAMEMKFSSGMSKKLQIMSMNKRLLLLLLLILMGAAATSEASRAVAASLSHHGHEDVAGMLRTESRRRSRELASDSGISISISYDGGETRVQNGQMLSVSETATHPPSLYISGGEGGGDEQEEQVYSVAMIDRMASRQPGSALLTFVHYWVLVRSRGDPQEAAMVEAVLAPYVRPAPHDALLHTCEFLVFAATPSTTSPPQSFLESDRYVQDFESLVQDQAPLASTRFTEQILSL